MDCPYLGLLELKLSLYKIFNLFLSMSLLCCKMYLGLGILVSIYSFSPLPEGPIGGRE